MNIPFTILRRRPLLFLFFPWHLLAGRARFKEWLSLQADLPPAHFPYHREFLQYLYLHHRTGRRLILATSANQNVVRAIAQYLGIFSEVYASTSRLNLKGTTKEDLLVEKFGRFVFCLCQGFSQRLESLAQCCGRDTRKR